MTEPTAPTDLRIRHADNLRAAVGRSRISWVTRQRLTRQIQIFETTAGPAVPTPGGLALEHLLALGELCSDPENQRVPSSDWALAAIERHLQTNPDL